MGSFVQSKYWSSDYEKVLVKHRLRVLFDVAPAANTQLYERLWPTWCLMRSLCWCDCFNSLLIKNDGLSRVRWRKVWFAICTWKQAREPAIKWRNDADLFAESVSFLHTAKLYKAKIKNTFYDSRCQIIYTFIYTRTVTNLNNSNIWTDSDGLGNCWSV